LDIGLQVVLIANALTEVLRLLAIRIVQTDFAKLPISKYKPLDGCTGDYPSSDYAEGSFMGLGGNMPAKAAVRVALISDASIHSSSPPGRIAKEVR
jgi:hypothetical protein